MITHPKQKPRVYPTVMETYEAAGLGVLGIPEKSDQNWIARKTYKSSFRNHISRSSYQPTNNTAANAARLEELYPKPEEISPKMPEVPVEPSTPTE